MATADGESLLDQFCAVTGASKDVGVRLLEACSNNLEMAIGMHMDGGEAQGDGPDQRASSSCPDENVCDDTENVVRAPIPQKREVLVEEGPVLAFRGRRRPAASVFDGFRDFQAEALQQEQSLLGGPVSTTSSNPSKQRTLEDLFRPPIDITFKGSFEKAREACMGKKKLLLVNIQNVQEFQCQVLNRDVWSHNAVRGIIKEHFIFWQVYHDSEEGKRYAQFYKVQVWPYIAVIDPITGENMKSWNEKDPVIFCDQVTEFLAHHRSDSESPPAKRQKKNSLVDASEDAQLEAAIKASMAESKSKTVYESDSDNDVETFSDSDSPDESEKNAPSNSKNSLKPKSIQFNSCAKSVDTNCAVASTSKNNDNKCLEPSSSSDLSKPDEDEKDAWKKFLGKETDAMSNLMLRFPNGNREQLSLPCTSKLMALVKFAASKGFPCEKFELVANFPRREISNMNLEKTIEEAGLHPQESVFVQARS